MQPHREEAFRIRPGQRFRCEVCGAETLVIKVGGGKLDLKCCNQPMVPLRRNAELYRCQVCGSEVAHIRSKGGDLRLICCNRPMTIFHKQRPMVA